jgi:hypothetical protein
MTTNFSGSTRTALALVALFAVDCSDAFYCGNDSDIAYDGCEGDFEITKVPTISIDPGIDIGRTSRTG